MNVLVVGLGLIGGSIAEGLSRKGYRVCGCDKDTKVLEKALEQKFISAGSLDAGDFLPDTDWIILALYPSLILPFINEYANQFTARHRITDVCGVKSNILEGVIEKIGDAHYLSCHPMAGKEKGGFEYADFRIFKDANFLITPHGTHHDFVIEELLQIAKDLGFRKPTIVSPEFHDRFIAYTSQLPHALAVALVNTNENINDTKNYTGDSYRDLTRIALINEVLWDELFFENKDFLIEEIARFTKELTKIKCSLENDDHDLLRSLFLKAKKTRGEL